MMAWILTNWKPIGAAALLVLAYLVGDHNGAQRVIHRWDKATTRQLQAEAKRNAADARAKEAASLERVADTTAVATAEKERTDAIDRATPGATGDATRRLACVRWARQHPGAAVPAGC